MNNWESINDTFIVSLDKELGNLSAQLFNFKTNLKDVQRRFAKHFERQTDTTFL